MAAHAYTRATYTNISKTRFTWRGERSDDGKAWSDATLGTDLGKYSWRLWRAQWTPSAKGSYRLQVRATTDDGQQQVTSQWNRSGYQRDVIEHVDVVVV